MNNLALFFNELGRASMCPENSSYNDITEMQSSESYLMKMESLYSNAISDLYGLNDYQRGITINRINEVRESQKYFDVPTKDTVNSMLRDYNAQPEGKRIKSLLDDYHYCQFVLECVAIQKEYLKKFASNLGVDIREEMNQEENQETLSGTHSDTSKMADEQKEWLTIDEAASYFRLPKNNIKDRQWRINHDFPYKGFDEKKGAYTTVIFSRKDIENWIRNQ